MEYEVFFVPGHTKDHCAFYDCKNNIIFIGDTLFSMGCGRLFEGTPQQKMYDSLNLLKNKINQNTYVLCAHEYTLSNAKFALSVDFNNQTLKTKFETVKKQRENVKCHIVFLIFNFFFIIFLFFLNEKQNTTQIFKKKKTE